MKEATGDLNMTVIVVILVAALVAFFSIFIGPMIIGGIRNDTNCADAICPCKNRSNSNGACNDCYMCTKDKNGAKSCDSSNTFSCPYKG